MKNAGVSVRNVSCDHCDLKVLHKCLCSSPSTLETEGDDTTGSVRHILLSSFVVFIAGKTGIGNPRHFVIAAKVFGDLLRVLAVSGHADSQRLNAEIEKESIHGSLDGTEISHELRGALGDESAAETEFLGVCDPMIGLIGSGEPRKLVCVRHPVEFAAVNDRAAYCGVVPVQKARFLWDSDDYRKYLDAVSKLDFQNTIHATGSPNDNCCRIFQE